MGAQPEHRWVYFAKRHGDRRLGLVKIGVANDPQQRVNQLGLSLLAAVKLERTLAERVEHAFHVELCAQRHAQRGSTEWFAVDARLEHLITTMRLGRIWPWDWRAEVLVG